MTCHSIIQFHFNLRIELKWIDFVGPVHSALTFIQFHSPFNFNALNGCEMKKESGSIPLRSVYFIQFTSWNEMKSLAAPCFLPHSAISAFMLRCPFRYTHSPSLTSFRHFQLLQSVNFGTFRYLSSLCGTINPRCFTFIPLLSLHFG